MTWIPCVIYLWAYPLGGLEGAFVDELLQCLLQQSRQRVFHSTSPRDRSCQNGLILPKGIDLAKA